MRCRRQRNELGNSYEDMPLILTRELLIARVAHPFPIAAPDEPGRLADHHAPLSYTRNLKATDFPVKYLALDPLTHRGVEEMLKKWFAPTWNGLSLRREGPWSAQDGIARLRVGHPAPRSARTWWFHQGPSQSEKIPPTQAQGVGGKGGRSGHSR